MWRYAYDAAGRLIAQDDPATGQSVHFCYDLEGRMTQKLTATIDTLAAVDCASPPAGWERVVYTYDTAAAYGVDRLHRVTEADGGDGTAWSYDPRGLPRTLAQTVGGRTAAFTFENYDSQDRPLSVRYPDCETVTTRYDATGQPAGLTGSDVYITEATYDVFGRSRRLVLSADPVRQVTETRDYHPAGPVHESHRLAGITVSKPGVTHVALAYPDYSARGFLEQIADNRDPTGNASAGAKFTYDDLGRLLTLDRTATVATPDESFAYDALGPQHCRLRAVPAGEIARGASRGLAGLATGLRILRVST